MGLMLTMLLAVACPVLLTFSTVPSMTLFNQAWALAGWGLVVMVLATMTPPSRSAGHNSGWLALWGALTLLMGAALASPVWTGLGWGMALSAMGLIAAAWVVAMMGAWAQRAGTGQVAFLTFCLALVLAGTLSLALACIQYFAPQWADGTWIAHAATPGRVGGNLRQPNHLSSLLLWAAAALIVCHDRWVPASAAARRGWSVATIVLMAGLMLGLVLTVSRTGTLCLLVLALWGVLDRRLSRVSRRLLWALPVLYLLCWWGVSAWAHAHAQVFSGADQLSKADLSSSRFGVWANTWSLIKLHPWFGVGWGEFNFAWSLTPFPGRSSAFFDHTHNLPLQLWVELGLPLGSVVMGLLIWAVWRVAVNSRHLPEDQQTNARCALVMVLMMGVHSLLEYPLWYTYFLLPTAFALGVGLGGAAWPNPPEPDTAAPQAAGRPLSTGMLFAGLMLLGGSGFCVLDYLSVVKIFSPSARAASLEQRIAEGQRSVFFPHHADYAATTTASKPSEVMPAFARTSHHLLDTRLMLAWARAFDERGDVERARYLADRLREFQNPQSEAFFAECLQAVSPPEALPFQCVPANQTYTFADFRVR